MPTKPKLERLRITLADWMARNGLNDDSRFYTQVEWRERGEDLLNDAHLVLVFEGDLFVLVNYETHYSTYDELIDLVEGFGFYFALGHTWSMGFYPQSENPAANSRHSSYSEKLRDPRWIEKRDKVRARAGEACEECGTTTDPLEVHHCYYRYAWEPWEYPMDSLLCLCRDCHKRRGQAEMKWRQFMPKLRIEAIENLMVYLDQQMFLNGDSVVSEVLEKIKPTESTVLYDRERFMSQRSD